MNLHGIVTPIVSSLFPNESVLMFRSTGYANTDGKRVPTYSGAIPTAVSIQALTFQDITLLNNLNIQGIRLAAYLPGTGWEGIDRPDGRGGDMMIRPDDSQWLIATVLERWPNWTKAAMTRQMR